MNKDNKSIIVYTLIIFAVIVATVMLFVKYTNDKKFNDTVISIDSFNIENNIPVTRIAVLGGNSKHFEIDNTEDIKEILNIIQGMSIKYNPDYSSSFDENIFTCRITVYTTWDVPILEITINDTDNLIYNEYKYSILEKSLDLEYLEKIVNEL